MKRRSIHCDFFRFWSYIHCLNNLIGFFLYSLSVWWTVTKTDEYYLLTIAGALVCYFSNSLINTWEKANAPEPEFILKDTLKKLQLSQLSAKGGTHE